MASLLQLPSELRLQIFSWQLDSRVIDWSSFTGDDWETLPDYKNPVYDDFDILNALRHPQGRPQDRNEARSYSVLFAHPTLHRETMKTVIRWHPCIFHSGEDVRAVVRDYQWAAKEMRTVVLDIGACNEWQMRWTISLLSKLPNLERLTVRCPRAVPSQVAGIQLPFYSCPSHTYTSLIKFDVVDKEAEERKALKEKARTIEDEAIANFLAQNEVRTTMAILQAVQSQKERFTRQIDALERRAACCARDGLREARYYNRGLYNEVLERRQRRTKGECTCFKAQAMAGQRG